MIKNFEEIKSQLKDLSGIINGFKSEAVQLRIVELVFGLEPEDDSPAEETNVITPKRSKSTKRKPSKKAVVKTKSKKSGAKPSGQGSVATLLKLIDEGFFSKPKSIGDIVEHCDHNLARKFKPNEFSGKLGRLVRDGTLKRSKNAENQYEYQTK